MRTTPALRATPPREGNEHLAYCVDTSSKEERNHAVIPLLWRGAPEGDGVVSNVPPDHPVGYAATPPMEGNERSAP